MKTKEEMIQSYLSSCGCTMEEACKLLCCTRANLSLLVKQNKVKVITPSRLYSKADIYDVMNNKLDKQSIKILKQQSKLYMFESNPSEIELQMKYFSADEKIAFLEAYIISLEEKLEEKL